MPTFTFNPQIDLGHVLTFVALVAGLITLYWQARSVRISEKELSFQVAELGEVIRRLEAESLARKQLETAQESQLIQQLNSHAEQLDYSSWVYEHFSSITSATNSLQSHRHAVLARSLVSIAQSLISDREQFDNSRLTEIVNLNNALFELLHIEMEGQEVRKERIGQWNQEFKVLLDQLKRNDTPANRNQIAKKHEELIKINTALNVRYANTLELPQQRYKEAKLQFMSRFNEQPEA